MARAKKPNKTRKTAMKRLRITNPKGNRKPKLRYKKSAQHHLRTKLSRRSKRRKQGTQNVHDSFTQKYKKIVSV